MIFSLPHSTRVDRVVPKNAFDSYANTKQRKLFTDLIQKITWTHKISTDTVNLPGDQIKEIQLFSIDLKIKDDCASILETIDKAIPYTIIFALKHTDEIKVCTSIKHPHPVKEDIAVIDWTFSSDWHQKDDRLFSITLKDSLDYVFLDFCKQFNGGSLKNIMTLNSLAESNKQLAALERDVIGLKQKLKKAEQYKDRVECNLLLIKAEEKLEEYRKKTFL